MEKLLSTILEALAEPAVSYIGLGYDKTIGIRAGSLHIMTLCIIIMTTGWGWKGGGGQHTPNVWLLHVKTRNVMLKPECHVKNMVYHVINGWLPPLYNYSSVQLWTRPSVSNPLWLHADEDSGELITPLAMTSNHIPLPTCLCIGGKWRWGTARVQYHRHKTPWDCDCSNPHCPHHKTPQGLFTGMPCDVLITWGSCDAMP